MPVSAFVFVFVDRKLHELFPCLCGQSKQQPVTQFCTLKNNDSNKPTFNSRYTFRHSVDFVVPCNYAVLLQNPCSRMTIKGIAWRDSFSLFNYFLQSPRWIILYKLWVYFVNRNQHFIFSHAQQIRISLFNTSHEYYQLINKQNTGSLWTKLLLKKHYARLISSA